MLIRPAVVEDADLGLAPAGMDLDGLPLKPFNWFALLVDYIAGTSDTDLGHQFWPGNGTVTGSFFSNTLDGHYEGTGVRSAAIPPLNGPEWGIANSDANAGQALITGWDINTLVGSVFTPPPVAIIAHPNASAGENFVPLAVLQNGQQVPFQVLFDPGGSFELNPDPNALLTHVRWDFGDGSAPVEADLQTPARTIPVGVAALQAHHAYTAVGDYVASLTVMDNQGNSNSASVVVHVIPPPFPPTPVLKVEALGFSHQNGDTVGVLPNGQVTLLLDASQSFNFSPENVMAPKNANGISAFAWEFPTNPAQGFNTGTSEQPAQFEEGVADNSGQLNQDSKAGVQAYTFKFDPNNVPSSIIIGLRVASNIQQTNGKPANSETIFRQINLAPNDQVTPGSLDLSITKTPDVQSAPVGSTVTYSLTVTNNGLGGVGVADANGAAVVNIADNLPAGLTFVEGSCSVTDNKQPAVGAVEVDNQPAVANPVCGGTGNNRTVTLGGLAAHGSATITLKATVSCTLADQSGIGNTATVSSAFPDPNASNNSATSTITASNPAPMITCPADVRVNADVGQCTAKPTLGAPTTVPAANSACPPTVVGTRSDSTEGATKALTDPFPIGDTMITWTATNGAGVSATCTQKVTVVDNEKPVITCPADVTKSVSQGVNSLTLNPGMATATDNCPGVRVTSARSDSTGETAKALTDPFPVGMTTITWTATDAAGNTSTCTQKVTVRAATITCPQDMTVNADQGQCSARVQAGTPTGTLEGATVTGVRSDSNSDHPVALTDPFPVGTTTITWTATDQQGSSARCTQKITVVDNQKPVITCPADISTRTDRGSNVATVQLGVPTVTDNCPNVKVTGVRSDEGKLTDGFPIGTTTVTLTATDASGNTATCTQQVTVKKLSIHTFPAGVDLVSAPYDYTGTGIDAAEVFGVPIGPDGRALIATFDPELYRYMFYPNLPGTQTEPGRGYWIKLEQDSPLENPGNPVPSPFQKDYHPGWNIIGDPFLTPLTVNNLLFSVPYAVGNNPPNTPLTYDQAKQFLLVRGSLWGWDGHAYFRSTELQPFFGYWIYVDPVGAQVDVQFQHVTITYSNPNPNPTPAQ